MAISSIRYDNILCIDIDIKIGIQLYTHHVSIGQNAEPPDVMCNAFPILSKLDSSGLVRSASAAVKQTKMMLSKGRVYIDFPPRLEIHSNSTNLTFENANEIGAFAALSRIQYY